MNVFPLSARNRRILALGVHGAADDSPLDTDALIARTDGVADLNDADIATLIDDLRNAAVDVLDATVDQASLDLADRIEAALNSVLETQAAREAEAERIAGEVAERRARIVAVEDPEPEAEADGPEDETDDDETPETETPDAPPAEPEVVETVEPPAAELETPEPEVEKVAASRTPVVSRVAARRPEIVKPRSVREDRPMKLMASANVPGVQAGTELDTPEKIAAVLAGALRASGSRHNGPTTAVPLFSVGSMDPADVYGEARTLGDNARDNNRKIDRVTSLDALRGTGGICAPLQVNYDMPFLASDARPVKAALAGFGVDHGGARFLTPPTLADVVDGVGVWTEANDVNPGSDGAATKTCVTLDCPTEFEQMVAAIYTCLEVGNMRLKFFPEQVKVWMDLLAVQAAKVSENRLIQKIGDESIQVDVRELLGTNRTILPAMDRARASFTSFHRVASNYPLRLLAPEWLKWNMISDLAREMPGSTDERLAVSEAKIQSFFAARNINVSWFLDGEAGQTFGAQADGFLNAWPDTAVVYLYLEGTWLHLDGGMYDFGIVRDSVLNGTNDAQIFSEFFEESIFHGPPGTSYRMEIDVCPNGQAAALADTSGLCTSGS